MWMTVCLGNDYPAWMNDKNETKNEFSAINVKIWSAKHFIKTIVRGQRLHFTDHLALMGSLCHNNQELTINSTQLLLYNFCHILMRVML